jgi:hypothetical protein
MKKVKLGHGVGAMMREAREKREVYHDTTLNTPDLLILDTTQGQA